MVNGFDSEGKEKILNLQILKVVTNFSNAFIDSIFNILHS